MTNARSVVSSRNEVSSKPKAIGLVRSDVSGADAARHAEAVQRHALALGHRYVYTVRPPVDAADPIGYVLAIAGGLEIEVLVVFDLEQVDNRPALVCDAGFDLETVCPQCTWARSAQAAPRAGAGAA
ncbi:hypothetical protein ACWEPH_29595 [Nocardia beijingensis]|uniref:hypothetical protein n=1 Tax=Nocardia beijingensis TaxID=95162 RepID=UPI001893CBE7|nr:hypothetical protein [Nocardia beijingensis]MBF6077826.1 hypothetical protein [Nocardia beijingensis]